MERTQSATLTTPKMMKTMKIIQRMKRTMKIIQRMKTMWKTTQKLKTVLMMMVNLCMTLKMKLTVNPPEQCSSQAQTNQVI